MPQNAPRKKAPRKATPAAAEVEEKNEAEAAAEEAAGGDLGVEFRGETFTIPRKRMESARFRLYFASGRGDALLLEMVGSDRRTQDRFIDCLGEDDDLVSVAGEFFGAVNAAAGSGNS